MKNKKMSIVLLTLLIAGIGAGMLLWSSKLIMADVQDDVASTEDIVDMQAGVESTENLAAVEEVSIATAEFVYYGQDVSIKDDMLEKETAIETGHKIMDFIFDYVDKTILKPYGIDKTAYMYDIQRQRFEDKSQCYGVFLKKDHEIVCTIDVRLNNGIQLNAFARDGLIDLYGGFDNPIPSEYLVENWCNDTQKKDEIYDAYYESSKEIVEKVLGMAPIDDSFRDVTNDSCFRADDEWSTVSFGYRLEDGTEITIFYNRVNQMWDGFCIQ